MSAAVGFLPLAVVEIVDDDAHGQAEELVKVAHPLGVALGQVVVHGDHVNALARQRVQIDRQGRDQGFSFTGLHLGDFALVQHHSADQLDVEMAHVQGAAAGFARDGERLDQYIVERGALREFFLEFDGLMGELLVGELLDGGFQIVDRGYQRPHRLDLACVPRAENLGEDSVKHSGDYFLFYQLPAEERRSLTLAVPCTASTEPRP